MTPAQAKKILKSVVFPRRVAVPTIVHIARNDNGGWLAVLDHQLSPILSHGAGACPDEAFRNAACQWLEIYRLRLRLPNDASAFLFARAELVRLTKT